MAEKTKQSVGMMEDSTEVPSQFQLKPTQTCNATQ